MNFPEQETPFLRELGLAMIAFWSKLKATRLGNDEEDAVMRQVATEEYRQAVELAASRNIEKALAWHTLAVWTENGRERIGCFARALECQRAETGAKGPTTILAAWQDAHMQAACLFEIGRVHFHEGAPEVARHFLVRALPRAQTAEDLREAAGMQDDRLEGRIAELLLKLPAEDEA